MNTESLIDQFSEYYQSIGRSEITIKHYQSVLHLFFNCIKKSHSEVVVEDVVHYISSKKYSEKTRYAIFNCLNIFYRYLEEEGLVLENIMLKVPKPKQHALLPTKVMTKNEAEKVLSIYSKNKTNQYEYRNRLILELLYSCSLRRSELTRLQLDDYDCSLKSLRVKQTKTNMTKLVPVGKVASDMLEVYIKELRPMSKNKTLFLGQRRIPLSDNFITSLVYKARKKSGIRTKASAHSFRKTSATQMLRNGAKIEVVQRLLGQKSIVSTTAYTKVYPVDIEKMIRSKHPREKQKNIKLPVLKVPEKLTDKISFRIK